jgi:hypothetical protein
VPRTLRAACTMWPSMGPVELRVWAPSSLTRSPLVHQASASSYPQTRHLDVLSRPPTPGRERAVPAKYVTFTPDRVNLSHPPPLMPSLTDATPLSGWCRTAVLGDGAGGGGPLGAGPAGELVPGRAVELMPLMGPSVELAGPGGRGGLVRPVRWWRSSRWWV